MNISEADVKRSKVLCRVNFSKSNIFAEIIGLIILSISEMILLYHYLSPVKSSRYSSNYETEQSIKYIFLGLCIIFFICSILILIRIHTLKNSFICLTELGVFGTGEKCFCLSSHPFALPYDQITRIYHKNDSVYLESGGIKYCCTVKKSYEITQGIKAEISLHK